MKITAVRTHPVNIPLVTGYRWAPGIYFGATKGLIEVETDLGVTGWGEVATAELAALVQAEFAQRLVGADPFDVDDCQRRVVPEIRTLQNTHDDSPVRAFGGVEIALWDIKGRALNLPVYQLLGGAARHSLGVAAAIPYLDQPGQSLLRWYADDIVSPLFEPRENSLPIPTGPGLGIGIDPAALQRCKLRFQREGPLPQLGEPGTAYHRRFRRQ